VISPPKSGVLPLRFLRFYFFYFNYAGLDIFP
jgi:hypothetical protein